VESVIQLSEALYKAIAKEAATQQRSPDELVEDLLTRYLLPKHPYVEHVDSQSGLRAVIRGTRVGIDVIVGYWRAGYTPDEIATDILPHLKPAEVYDALSYYHDHEDEIEQELAEHTVETWQDRLKDQMGEAAYFALTGAPPRA
jgi:uncharacterized protein (DUF433 family)